jgi:hypothetical protein
VPIVALEENLQYSASVCHLGGVRQ